MMPMTAKSYEHEIQKLEVIYSPPTHTPPSQTTLTQEAVKAYKAQNGFLSSELVELNAVRAEDNTLRKALER